MKIVILERNSAGTDIEMDFSDLGEVVCYPNTVTKEETNSGCGYRCSKQGSVLRGNTAGSPQA